MKRAIKKVSVGLGIMVLMGATYVACSSCCIRAGSMVMTPDGLRAIETIEAGDTVLSYDPATKTYSENKVVETYDKVGFTWAKATFADGTCLEATTDHEAYDAGSRTFTEVGKVGQFVRIDAGRTAVALEGTHSREYGLTTFHDLRLEKQPHTYVANGVVVHNKGGFLPPVGAADTTQIAGTYVVTGGSSIDNDSPPTTVTFNGGTIVVNQTGAVTYTLTGDDNSPGTIGALSASGSGTLTGGSGLGPFTGTLTGTGQDSDTPPNTETTVNNISSVVVDGTGLMTVTYTGTSTDVTGTYSFTGNFTAQGPGQPDFSVLLAVTNGSVFNQNDTVNYFFDSGNTGGTRTVRVGIYMSDDVTIDPATDTLMASQNVTIGSGISQSASGSFVLTAASFPPGPYWVGVFVDDLFAITESDENNNTDSNAITVN